MLKISVSVVVYQIIQYQYFLLLNITITLNMSYQCQVCSEAAATTIFLTCFQVMFMTLLCNNTY